MDTVETINNALDNWYDGIDKAMDIITTDPRLMGGGMVNFVIANLYNVTEAVGIALLILCFYVGIFGSASSMAETKRPEAVFRLCVRTAVTGLLVSNGFDLMGKILDICQSLVADLNVSVSITATPVPNEIRQAVANLGWLEELAVWIVSLLGSLAITVATIIILLTVYGRFFKVYLYMILCPIPLATFAAKSTSQICISYLKSYIGVCLEAVIVVVSIKIYEIYSTSVLSSPLIDTTASASSMVWSYLETTIFNILLLVTIIKTSTTLVREMFGI